MPTFKDQLQQLMAALNRVPRAEREPRVQRFFERNPHLVTAGEYLNPKMVISKLPIGNWECDFAYIHPESGPHYLFMIEIEDPTKKIFTDARDEFTAEFNHALQQVHDWLVWTSKNPGFLRQLYQDAATQFPQVAPSMLFPRGILVFGRRDETATNPIRIDRWRQKKHSELNLVQIMTYDGLIERHPRAFASEHRDQFDPVSFRYARRGFIPIF